MAPPVPARASKQRILDLLTLALGATPLREMGVDAIRSVLGANPRIAVLDGAFDLEPVWDLLASQEGFDPEVAKPPFALLKSLEGRLGVQMKLPLAMAALTPPEITRFAGVSAVRREEIDKIVAAVTVESLEVAPRPHTSKPVAQDFAPASVDPGSPRRRRKTIFAAAVAIAAVSVVWVGVFLFSQGTSDPTWKALGSGELGTLPVADAKRWNTEVRATLTDPAWLKRPEPDRRQEMTKAFATLSRDGVAALVLVDSEDRVRASAQQGKSGTVVKFY
jgi:hypothetical protein